MEYPDGEWKCCKTHFDWYFKYEDGVGRCPTCSKNAAKSRNREIRRFEKLEKENKKLKEQLTKQR